VIHRDLKPAHVMVGAFGEIQVIGWGLATVLGAQEGIGREPTAGQEPTAEMRPVEVVGTPVYMPPEQARGNVADCRSDVFGLGGILCAILTGGPPFSGPGPAEVVRTSAAGAVGGALARLDGCGADPTLVALAKRCLSPSPADRPADASEVARAVVELRQAAEERAREAWASRIAADARADEQRKRRRVQLALAAAVGLLVVACGALAWR
jgi:serine/threonine protein kinase